MSMTIGEARHMAVVEAQLRRIADAMEAIARAVAGRGENEKQGTKGANS